MAESHVLQQKPADAPRRAFGRFRLEDCLASCGVLETHRARVAGLAGFDRLFVVRSLRHGVLMRQPDAAGKLMAAARAINAVAAREKRIHACADMGLDSGTAFVVSELVHGISLDEVLYVRGLVPVPPPIAEVSAQARWPVWAAFIGAEVARALSAAHESSPVLLHENLVPGNVMLTGQGGVKVLDMGLRAALHSPEERAMIPEYRAFLAPEVVRGQDASAQSDVYSLGVLLGHLATGAPLSAIVEDADRVAERLAGLPTALRLATSALLDPDPTRRPSAAKAAELLRSAVGAAPDSAVQAELAAVVRKVQQALLTAPARHVVSAPPAPEISRPTREVPVAGEDDPPAFATFEGPGEATSMLVLGRDGNPEMLAALMSSLQNDKASAPGRDRKSTPVSGNSLVELADLPSPGATAEMPRESDLSEAPAPVVALAPDNGVPEGELPDMTTAEVSAALPESLLMTGPPAEIPKVWTGTNIPTDGAVENTRPSVYDDFSNETSFESKQEERGLAAPALARRKWPLVLGASVLLGGALIALIPKKVPPPAAVVAPAVVAPPVAAKPVVPVEPVAPPAPEPQGLIEAATVQVVSEPKGAAIWFDGKEVGKTPKAVTLPAGARELQLVRLGFKLLRVTLPARPEADLSAVLEPTTAPPWGKAVLVVDCKVRGKRPVLVDGAEIGLLCPTGRVGLLPGTHEIGVLDPATGQIETQTVELAAGTKRVRFK